MINKSDIITEGNAQGFEDVGFTTADPFPDHKQYLLDRRAEYKWAEDVGLDLLKGTDPKKILPTAKTIIVLMEVYFRKAYPRDMEGNFGRCYLDDDRVTHDGLYKRIKAFRSFLRDNGIDSRVPFNLPHRMAAARAGMGTFGKNCLFYSNKVARKSSWTLPIAVVIDKAFEPDVPTMEMDCPDWCKNTCIAACPTRALEGNGRIDPRKCISYLTYFGDGITPIELREPMGMFVYGCDRCQDVCPRNQPWLAQKLPINKKVIAKADDFELSRLLHMDREYFKTKIWPHMFYISDKNIWRWKMNVARVMGNSHDKKYIFDLVRAFAENSDERVRAMAVWAIGNIGGEEAEKALKKLGDGASDLVKKEIRNAKSKKHISSFPLDCHSCILDQARSTARIAKLSKDQTRRVINGAMEKLKQSKTVPLLAQHIIRYVTDTVIEERGESPDFDIYARVKEHSNLLSLSYAKKFQKKIDTSESPLETGLKIAAAGNIIDFGAKRHGSIDLDKELRSLDKNPFTRYDFEPFKKALNRAMMLLYICDNSGEIVFDMLLIKEVQQAYPDLQIIAAVRQRPIINDATLADARSVGLDQLVTTISSGSIYPGTLLSETTQAFQKLFASADVILSKGQGNFETLLPFSDQRLFFLLRIKCEHMAALSKEKKNNLVLMQGQKVKRS